MADTAMAVQRPKRWDVPFGPEMTDADVSRVLDMEPFSAINASSFPSSTPLHDIILNDCRIVRYNPGDIIVREGDYGHSLFFIMQGDVRVALDKLGEDVLGRKKSQKKSILQAVAQLWTNHRGVEQRDLSSYDTKTIAARRGTGIDTRVFLQDVPGILESCRTVLISTGEFFGELAALSRIPRSATLFADTECELLELRWQGFRDLRRRATELREHVDRLYRERSLASHLRSTAIFSHLTDEQLAIVAEQTVFETYGEFDWYASYKKIAEADPARRLAHEPVIAEEGHYPNGVILIRAGFARQSCRYGSGERTMSYLGRGHVFGFDEIAHNAYAEQTINLRSTLRAVGYVDVLRIPTVTIEKFVLSGGHRGQANKYPDQMAVDGSAQTKSKIDSGLLEFIVENRYMNGTAAMLIDLDRCTRCDDCVRACADTHDNNPRFVRHGPTFDNYMVANACMHCADPVCMIGCPTGAIHRDPQGGQVVINDLTCIGCATCANSCPYHNIRMVEITDNNGSVVLEASTNLPIEKATKCDLCSDQLGGPACQRACPHDALVRIDMTDHEALAKWVNR